MGARIQYNVFPHDGLEGDAIALQTRESVDFETGNVIRTDTFGEYYSACDFDGDGIDDLFLATGTTWWYSSAGRFHWSYLNTSSIRTSGLRFGYFDDDNRCDVLSESGDARWFISSGGSAPWKALELAWGWQPFDGAWRPLKDVAFGRFDPNDAGASRQTTHAFYRDGDGFWHLKRLSADPTLDWEHVGGSSFPIEELGFGDFDGDGVTDVLAVERGRWAYSRGARETWQTLNRSLGATREDAVSGLVIANMDADDSKDDILRFEVRQDRVENGRLEAIWWRSKDGIYPWTEFKRYSFTYQPGDVGDVSMNRMQTRIGFVGRFGSAGRGGTLVIDGGRTGHFYSPAEAASAHPGACDLNPAGLYSCAEWTSDFPYQACRPILVNLRHAEPP